MSHRFTGAVRGSATIVLALALGLTAQVPAVRAEGSEEACTAYANTAVEQYRENLDRACGFMGARWIADPRLHYGWCRSVPMALADAETEGRQADLETRCLEAGSAERESCRRYAAEATRQNEENLARGCGLADSRWSSDESAHYSWCLGVPDELSAAEIATRRSQLSGCRESAPRTGEFAEEWASWRLPDPAVTRLVVPERSQAGEPVALVATVTNVGRGTAAAAELVFEVGGEEVARRLTEELSAGSDSELRVEWRAAQPGRMEVAARLDLGGGQIDGDGGNNLRTAVLRVAGDPRPAPELELDLRIDPAELADGPVPVRLVARNPSFAELGDVSLEVAIDGESVHQETIDSLGAGEERQIEFSWIARPGQHVITSSADPPDDIFGGDAPRIRSWALTIGSMTTICGYGFKDDWISIGPRILTNKSVGRMDAIAIDPAKSSVLHAGAASGGLWRSTDRGANWRAFGDRLPHLEIRDVEIDPKSSRLVYAVSGYGRNPASARDAPFFKSVDGGEVWETFASGVAQGASDLEIRYSSAGKLYVFAATNGGLLRYTSSDPWARTSGPGDWVEILDGTIQDIAVGGDGSLIYASVLKRKGGKLIFDALYRSRNGTAAPGSMQWRKVTPAKPAGVVVDIHPKDADQLFASVRRSGGVDIYRGEGQGDSWKKLVSREDNGRSDNQYNPFVRVTEAGDTIFYGGVKLYKAEKGSDGTWRDRPVDGIHADQKTLELDPTPGSAAYYVLNDGGVWHCRIRPQKSDDCRHRNYNLRTTQLFDFDPGSTTGFLLAGTQDNGTIFYDGKPDWREVRVGDGYYSLIAPSDNDIWYSQYQALKDTGRSSDGGGRWIGSASGLPQTGWAFGQGFITVSPLDANLVYAQGDQVLRSIDGGRNWTPIGPRGSNVKGYVNRVAVQPGTGLVFAGTTDRGRIWVLRGTWSLLSSHPDRAAYVTRMAFAPTDPKILYVTYKGGDDYRRVERFEYSASGGWNGSYITDNLPGRHAVGGRNVEIYAIAGDGTSSTVAYVGTDQGVYRGEAPRGNCTWDWKPYNKCLPLTKITDLVVDPSSKELRAATWGRGAWSVVTKP